jgi:hypothetical protein
LCSSECYLEHLRYECRAHLPAGTRQLRPCGRALRETDFANINVGYWPQSVIICSQTGPVHPRDLKANPVTSLYRGYFVDQERWLHHETDELRPCFLPIRPPAQASLQIPTSEATPIWRRM